MENSSRSQHGQFAFGDNWADYSTTVTAVHVESAQQELQNLLGRISFQGLSWCDLGSGSGIHSVAAALLGAEVMAIDIDEASCETTLALAARFECGDRVTVRQASALELPNDLSTFDVVYSWGVLHHTGALWAAMDSAVNLLSERPGSQFALALYRKTRLCPLWKIEKRIYARSGPKIQRLFRKAYTQAYAGSLLLAGRSIRKKRESYSSQRGMSLDHDVHDWLGGFPYESCVPSDVRDFLGKRGLVLQKEILIADEEVVPAGIFGSGCDQYVFRRPSIGF